MKSSLVHNYWWQMRQQYLLAILDHLTDSQLQSTSVVAIAEDAEHYDPTLHDFQSRVHSVTILEASLDEQAERVMELLRSEYQREYDYSWLCGESTLAKSTRAVVVKEWGITKTNVLFSGYWKLGKYVG